MRWRPEFIAVLLTFLLLVGATPSHAQAAPKASVPITATPDYGGRESPPATTAASDELPSLNPAAQIGRALGALALVLALVFGVLFALKKFGLASVKLPGKIAATPSDSPMLLRGSQPLPGTPGAFVHLLTIADRTLLVGATAQQITVLSEWESVKIEKSDSANSEEKSGENSGEDRAFEAYLQRQEMTPPALVIQTARARVGQAAERLSALAKEKKAD